MRDNPDEFSSVSAPPVPDEFSAASAEALKYIEWAGVHATDDFEDFEPDLYAFNFMGYTGKFIIPRNGGMPVTMPRSSLYIQRVVAVGEGGYFLIVTPDGVKYTFNVAERSSSSSGSSEKSYTDEIPTAWYLGRIEDPTGDHIDFSYLDTQYTYKVSQTQTVSRPTQNGTCGGASSECSLMGSESISGTLLTIRGKRLQKIESGNGYIEFIASQDRTDFADYKLNQVLLKDASDVLLKEITLGYEFSNTLFGYSTGSDENDESYKHRMFLTSLTEKDKNGAGYKKHIFEYESKDSLPPRFSFAQDHWGFFNGKSNSYFVPKNTTSTNYLGQPAFVGIGGDREPDHSFAKNGLLTKVTYPTGGYSQMAYEPNDYFGSKKVYPPLSNASLSVDGTDTQESIIINNPATQTIEWQMTGFNSSAPTTAILTITNQTLNTATSFSVAQSETVQGAYQVVKDHSYTFTLDLQLPGSAAEAAVSFQYYPTEPVTVQTNIPTGGMRVAQVTNHDPVAGKEEILKYYYAKHNLLEKSSGKTYGTPEYYTEYFVRNECAETTVLCDSYDCHTGVMSSSNKSNLFQVNNNVYYQYVTIARGENLNAGFEEHEFTISFDSPAEQIWGNNPLKDVASSNTAWDNGREKYVRYFSNKAGHPVLVREVFNHYVTDLRAYSESKSFVFLKTFEPVCQLDAVIECSAEDAVATSSYYQCTANHDHNYRTPWPWEIQTAHCMANDSNLTEFIIYHPCYGKPNQTIILPYNLDFIDGMMYRNISDWAYLDKKIETSYSANGANPLVTETQYFYDNPAHLLLSRSLVNNSDGNSIETTTKYPLDFDRSASTWVASLQDSLMTGKLIRRESTVNGLLSGGEIVQYNGAGQPKEVYKLEIDQPTQTTPHDPQVLIPSGNYKLKASLTYDQVSNSLSSVRPENSFITTYIWGYNNSLAIAEFQNAEEDEVAYTSFEDESTGHWQVASSIRDINNFFTGRKSYSLSSGNIAKGALESSAIYKVTFWLKEGSGSATLNGSSPQISRIVNGWALYSAEITGVASVTIAGTGTIDELRLHPAKAQATTYTYDPLVGVTSMTDQNNLATYYEYDASSRLALIRDYEGNVKQKFEYDYVVK